MNVALVRRPPNCDADAHDQDERDGKDEEDQAGTTSRLDLTAIGNRLLIRSAGPYDT